jgi:hypothetical protein
VRFSFDRQFRRAGKNRIGSRFVAIRPVSKSALVSTNIRTGRVSPSPGTEVRRIFTSTQDRFYISTAGQRRRRR